MDTGLALKWVSVMRSPGLAARLQRSRGGGGAVCEGACKGLYLSAMVISISSFRIAFNTERLALASVIR